MKQPSEAKKEKYSVKSCSESMLDESEDNEEKRAVCYDRIDEDNLNRMTEKEESDDSLMM